MKLRSIRWQLPLSYAAIAAIAALALGAVLLTVLRDYYADEERHYMQRNAQAFSGVIGDALMRDISVEELNAQLSRMSFITKTHVQLMDTEGDVIADSGPVGDIYVSFADYATHPLEIRGDASDVSLIEDNPLTITFLRPEGNSVISEFDEAGSPRDWIEAIPAPTGGVFTQEDAPPVAFEITDPGFDEASAQPGLLLPVTNTLYGFDFSARPRRQILYNHSDQRINVAIYDASDKILGSLNVFDGPAYGRDIVNSVARGWAIASGIAVILSGAIGWGISNRITAPLVALTNATARMTDGDLSARTHIQRKDELGTLADSFNNMAERIENTVSALRRFVADAAHEIHTPLTALRTNLELVDETNEQPATRRAIAQLQRLESLADDLLDLSRIEAGSDVPDMELVDLTAMIGETSEIYASRAEQADISFQLDLPEERLSARGNLRQLQRLFSNLLDNAVKFTPVGGVVSVNMCRDHGNIEIYVRDTGIGIPSDDMSALFERFKRGRNVSDYAGSGLGLAIVKAIVNAHHGDVSANSDSDGTTLKVLIPEAIN
jgi:signal transduction histidine kinase